MCLGDVDQFFEGAFRQALAYRAACFGHEALAVKNQDVVLIDRHIIDRAKAKTRRALQRKLIVIRLTGRIARRRIIGRVALWRAGRHEGGYQKKLQ